MTTASIRSAAEDLGVTVGTMKAAVARGEIKHMKVGARVVVDMDSARLWAESRGTWMSMKDYAARIGWTVGMVRIGIREGWIPAERKCREWRIRVKDADAEIERRMKGG